MNRLWRLLGALIISALIALGGPAHGRSGLADSGLAQPGAAGETVPASDCCMPIEFAPEDEIILEVSVSGSDAPDVMTGFARDGAAYLPLGAMARLLDLAIRIEDGGWRADGWVLEPDRTLSLDLREGVARRAGEAIVLDATAAGIMGGELYLRSDWFAHLLPLQIEVDQRAQQVLIRTTEPFPFQERLARAAAREKLLRRASAQDAEWPIVPLAYRAATVPSADLALRVVSDSGLGSRIGGDLRLAGDLAWMGADLFVTGDSADGLTGALLALGRFDPQARLLGPLRATEYTVGDVSSFSLPLGLAAVTGRGVAIANTERVARSVFDTIDLRGVLPEGFEVELFRNGILLGSLRGDTERTFFFPQVPVEFGLNEFLLVFHGPQGQRREEVRRFMVGDGRLPPGRLTYRVAALQKDRTLLGVEGPRTFKPADRGDLRVAAEVGYGVTPNFTTVVSGAWVERTNPFVKNKKRNWMFSAGARTGIGRWAAKADIALAGGGGWAATTGIAGYLGVTSVTATHSRYGGGFEDDIRPFAQTPLAHVTEVDLRTNLVIGPVDRPLALPLSLRARHMVDAQGGREINAAVRASAFLPGVLAAGSLEFRQTALGTAGKTAQLFGNFDLAARGQGRTRLRAGISYEIVPRARLVTADAQVDRALGPDSSLRATLGYDFARRAPQGSIALVRQFDRFSLSADAGYRFSDGSYAVGMRLAASLGRDPLRGRFFVARPGMAAGGGAIVRAFQDMDGDGRFGANDRPLPDVTFMTSNELAKTDTEGVARLVNLPAGQPVSLQLDPASLPDITLAPLSRGVTVVPRGGRLQAADYPVVALGAVEGTVAFADGNDARPVASVRLHMLDDKGQIIAESRSESDGYYVFEEVRPGAYTITLDPSQAGALDLCLAQAERVAIGFAGDNLRRNLLVKRCTARPQVAAALPMR